MNYFVQFTILCMYFDIFLPTTLVFIFHVMFWVLGDMFWICDTWILMSTFFYDLSWFFHNFFSVLCSVLHVSSESDPSHRDRSVSVPAESATETETLNHARCQSPRGGGALEDTWNLCCMIVYLRSTRGCESSQLRRFASWVTLFDVSAAPLVIITDESDVGCRSWPLKTLSSFRRASVWAGLLEPSRKLSFFRSLCRSWIVRVRTRYLIDCR